VNESPSRRDRRFPPTAALVVLGGLLCLHPWFSGATALLLGLAIGLSLGNPIAGQTRLWTPRLLQLSVIGLGAAMDLVTVAKLGVAGLSYTVVGITLAMVVGLGLGRLIGLPGPLSTLLSVGTAICGGSAIAAVSPVIGADEEETASAVAVVFLLNGAALLFFPSLGAWLGLDAARFGLFCALAIHDTSSVVGAAATHSPEALGIATAVKLARALWIVPLTLGIAWVVRRRKGPPSGPQKPLKYPWFILGFLAMAALVSWVPALREVGAGIAWAARRTLVLALFLTGVSVTRAVFARLGVRPLVVGVVLWALVIGATVVGLQTEWISAQGLGP
jgi:uncharacterized integral membrane protein (TIGR00698 family)